MEIRTSKKQCIFIFYFPGKCFLGDFLSFLDILLANDDGPSCAAVCGNVPVSVDMFAYKFWKELVNGSNGISIFLRATFLVTHMVFKLFLGKLKKNNNNNKEILFFYYN